MAWDFTLMGYTDFCKYWQKTYYSRVTHKILISYSKARTTSIFIALSLLRDSHEGDGDRFGWISTHAKSCNMREILSRRIWLFYTLYVCLPFPLGRGFDTVSSLVKNSLEPRLMSISLIKGKCRRHMKCCLSIS